MYQVAQLVAVIISGFVIIGEDDATAKDLKRLQGTWEILSMTQGGMEKVHGKVEDAKVVISANELTLMLGKDTALKAIFKLDATKKPATLELGLAKEKGFPNKGIYQLTGDMLTLCWGGDGEPRPAKLRSTAEGDERLLVLRRLKK